MFSPSPDLSLNYVMAVKKVGDVVTQGWVTREGPRQFETNHGIRLAGLEPNTKYYYNLRSWTFINNDETNNPQDKVGYVGSITTLPGSPPPTVKIRVRSPSEGNISIPDMPVILTKNTDLDFRLSVSTGQSGVSNDVILDKGTTYTFEAQGNACYEYGSAQLEVASTAQGPLPEVVINVNKIAPRRGFVLDSQNHGYCRCDRFRKEFPGSSRERANDYERFLGNRLWIKSWFLHIYCFQGWLQDNNSEYYRQFVRPFYRIAGDNGST